MSKIPKTQRALVLQGGGSLGAYEVGVMIELFKKLRNDTKDDQPLFDIIAGTSIGAINATILVDYVTKRKKENSHLSHKECWSGVEETLKDFWKSRLAVSTPLNAQIISNGLWWKPNESNNDTNDIATREAARRYYSTKQFFTTGIDTVFSRPEIIYDTKFFDNFPYSPPNNVWYRYNNTPLRKSIEAVVGKNFALRNKSYHLDDQDNSITEGPRLLVVSVDVADSSPVTFDSYGNQNNESKDYEWKTEYGHNNDKHIIRYTEGINLDHVMASASIPIKFDYQEIGGRKFWDGGVLSNTPLRELIARHKDFWKNELGEEKLEDGKWKTELDELKNDKVPDLEIYIINVWSSKEENLPSDYDGVKDRYNDIRYNDKTKYDETVTTIVSDYIHLVKEIRNSAIDSFKNIEEKKKFIQSIEGVLKRPVKSQRGNEKDKTKKNNDLVLESLEYTDTSKKNNNLILGSVELTKVVRIERQDNKNNISSKYTDFTIETINELIDQGKCDAITAFQNNHKKLI